MVTHRTPGQSSHSWAHQTYENPAPYRRCLGHHEKPRPVGQLTSDPTFVLPHRQVTEAGKHLFMLQEVKC